MATNPTDRDKSVISNVDGDRHDAPSPTQPIRTTIPGVLAAQSAGTTVVPGSAAAGSTGASGGSSGTPGIQPIGATSDVDISRALKAVVSTMGAVAKEVGMTAQMVAMLNERQTRYAGSSAAGTGVGGPIAARAAAAQSGDQTLQQAFLNYGVMGGSAAMMQANSGGGYGATTPNPFGHMPSAFQATEASEAARSRRRHSQPQTMVPSVQEDNTPAPGRQVFDPRTADPVTQKVPTGPELWQHIQSNRHYDVGSLRQDVGKAVGRKLSEFQYGPQLGKQYDPGEGKEGPSLWRHLDPDTGEFGDVASEDEVGTFLKHEQIASSVRGAGGQLASGEGVGSVVSGILPKSAKATAGATAVFEMAKHGADFMANQRAENAQWQEIMGGSNAEGFKMRMRSQMYGVSQAGGMGMANAQRLFEESNRLGYRGDDLQNALDSASDWYKKFGMSVEESSKLLEVAANTGQKSLAGFTRALSDVTKSARDAGVSAQQARANFAQNLEQTSEIAGPGNAPMLAAASVVAAQSYGGELGRTLNFSNENSQTGLMLQARQMGTGVNGLIAAGLDPTGQGALKIAQARDRQRQQVATRLLGVGGQQQAQNFLKAQGIAPEALAAGKEVGQGQMDDLARQWLEANAGRSDVASLPDILASLGGPTGLTQKDAVQYLFQTYMGSGSEASQIRVQQQKGMTRQINTTAKQTDPLTGQVSTVQSPEALKAETYVGRGSIYGKGASRGVQEAFSKSVERTGRVGGISQMIKQGAANDVTHLKVKTANGERVVSMEDAMTYYRDQVDAGTAVVVGGNNDGSTLAESLAVQGDAGQITRGQNAKKGSTSSSITDPTLGKHGQDVKDYEAKHQKTSDGKIIITGNPDLIRALGIKTQGNVGVDSRLGPPPSQVSQNQLPGDSSVSP